MAPSLQFFKDASSAKLPFYANNKDIFIGDTVTSIADDPEKPITAGFFDVEKGAKHTATFAFSEAKYVISGDIVFSDGNGQRVVAKAGEVVYIPKGSTSKYRFLWGSLGLHFLTPALQLPLRVSREERPSMGLDTDGLMFQVAQRLLNQEKRAGLSARL
ncbi:uncharacterized protein A1O9_05507 [Exophiala aquamarina CBS 119918]|uniref:(S)-ureidoglycine aminohydrolase cupin domain-containing protein n=1 Tax=Exophiala aquamarina CBS 119918 TaxID=1182545 RepID=A0A072PBU0_9EURO|nr:uncharacterized protein A1O9_05507 [Exophiala aquamarina CBS 119918]KEF57589.1 hypothetical protein A1O9_05507 [Exophiala aquamarina CBS 119918]